MPILGSRVLMLLSSEGWLKGGMEWYGACAFVLGCRWDGKSKMPTLTFVLVVLEGWEGWSGLTWKSALLRIKKRQRLAGFPLLKSLCLTVANPQSVIGFGLQGHRNSCLRDQHAGLCPFHPAARDYGSVSGTLLPVGTNVFPGVCGCGMSCLWAQLLRRGSWKLVVGGWRRWVNVQRGRQPCWSCDARRNTQT